MIHFDLEETALACEPEAVYAVNKELNIAWDIIEETGANLFLTGRAGTGKTTFLKKLRESTSKRMIVLAPTGVAAINANGATLHSFFQLPFAPYIPGRGFISEDKKFLNVNRQKKRLIASLSLLVIDEISMVRPDMLDAIDNILRRLRNSSLPFGGLQLLLIGDLRQLPPVVKDTEWNLLKDHYPSPYFFDSQALRQAGYQTVELSTVYRQSDRFFLDILNKIRDGKADTSTLHQLNSRCVASPGQNFDEDGYIRLTTHNNRAAIINESRLASLPSPEFIFTAEIEGNFPESAYPAEKNLRLKEGAQVMFVKNDTGTDRRYYNGLIGKVVSLSDEKIIVSVPGANDIIEVPKVEWENSRYVIIETTKAVTQERIGAFRQYPLQLAWAITIHKSQGLTFDKAIIDAAHSFAPGQTYVALSRCRSLEGLKLDTPIPLNAIITDRGVNDFVAYYESNTPDPDKVASLKDQYLYSLFLQLFDFEPLRRNFEEFCRYIMEYIIPLHPELGKELDQKKADFDSKVFQVAQKFTRVISPDTLVKSIDEGDSKLPERIKNGAEYFLNLLDEFIFFILNIPKDIENQMYADRLNNVSDSLLYNARLKRNIFVSMKVLDFSIPNYLNAQAKAVLELDKPDARKRPSYGKTAKPKAAKKEKKPKGYSTFETLRYFKEGKTIPEIAESRGLSANTIAGHIVQLIELKRIQPEEVMSRATMQRINKAINENPRLGLNALLHKINSSGGNPIASYEVKICQELQHS